MCITRFSFFDGTIITVVSGVRKNSNRMAQARPQFADACAL
jgi:hypothetical protein